MVSTFNEPGQAYVSRNQSSVATETTNGNLDLRLLRLQMVYVGISTMHLTRLSQF